MFPIARVAAQPPHACRPRFSPKRRTTVRDASPRLARSTDRVPTYATSTSASTSTQTPGLYARRCPSIRYQLYTEQPLYAGALSPKTVEAPVEPRGRRVNIHFSPQRPNRVDKPGETPTLICISGYLPPSATPDSPFSLVTPAKISPTVSNDPSPRLRHRERSRYFSPDFG